jgi:hypothetical protein
MWKLPKLDQSQFKICFSSTDDGSSTDLGSIRILGILNTTQITFSGILNTTRIYCVFEIRYSSEYFFCPGFGILYSDYKVWIPVFEYSCSIRIFVFESFYIRILKYSMNTASPQLPPPNELILLKTSGPRRTYHRRSLFFCLLVIAIR